jgi:hypothetical protein
MTEKHPEHSIEDEVEVRIGSDRSEHRRGIVLGISYVCPIYMYIVQLDVPIESEFGLQTGLSVPESILVAKPDISNLTNIKSIGSYVFVFEDDGVINASDVKVSIGSDDGLWYVISEDDLDGDQPVIFTSFPDQVCAETFACNYLEENYETGPGETAKQYLEELAIVE